MIKQEEVPLGFETTEEVSETKNLEEDYTFNPEEKFPQKRKYNYKKKTECKECDFSSFSLSGNFNRHMKTMHQGLKFQCPHCKYMASRNDNLQTHIKRRHLKKKQTTN